MQEENKYYKEVNEYYNHISCNFESRYWDNQTFQRIRNSFRNESNKYVTGNVLEIGFGSGLDIIHFAKKHTNLKIHGIDVSEGMYSWASNEIEKLKLKNTNIKVGSVEDIDSLFPNIKFDFIFVYFGALNTVENIDLIPSYLKNTLHEDGTMVLTFVNKWYALGILKPLIKLKFKTAFTRLQKTWGGYSPIKFLASKCYTSSQIKQYFADFELIKRRGYSILFPAWYENSINLKYPKVISKMWEVDKKLQKTPFWNLGEYSLYVFKHLKK